MEKNNIITVILKNSLHILPYIRHRNTGIKENSFGSPEWNEIEGKPILTLNMLSPDVVTTNMAIQEPQNSKIGSLKGL